MTISNLIALEYTVHTCAEPLWRGLPTDSEIRRNGLLGYIRTEVLRKEEKKMWPLMEVLAGV